ncbi:MAG: NAD(P)-dependent oxidoreductase [Alphaproteobacteria bacterium]
MPDAPPTLVVAQTCDAERRAVIAEAVGDAGRIVYLEDVAEADRPAAVAAATAVFAVHVDQLPDRGRDIGPGCRLLQFHSAGVDYLPLAHFPADLPIAGNGGAFAEPMAEHGLAMALAAGKRLAIEHQKMREGEFNQFVRNRMFMGGTAGILGLGGIGVATAKLFKALGMRIHAINRRGATDADVEIDRIDGPDGLDALLAASDVVVLSLPYTQTTEKLIDKDRLARMKPDAILVNLARGEIVDEDALYAHLLANPKFVACIDAWWVEPIRHGRFETGHPFLDLPNVIASPHNSASVGQWRRNAVHRAASNCARALRGETPLHLIGPEERMR